MNWTIRFSPSKVAFILTFMMSVSWTALAEEEPNPEDREFEAIVTQAVEHYEAQRYEQAISSFQRAYEMRAQPELVYNIARIYERSLELQQAVDTYERFLSLPNTTADLRSRAANSLALIRAEIAARERAERAGQENTTPGGGTGTGQGISEQDTGEQPEIPPEERASAVVITGWALVGVGAAALVAGIAMGGLTLAEETATEEAGNLADQELHLDRGESFALSADVLFGGGGALAVAGIALLIVHAVRSRSDASEDGTESDEDDESNFDYSLTPFSLARGGLGLSLGGTF